MKYIPEGVGNIARASLVAFEAIEAFRTHPVLAVGAFEARLTDAGSADVVALGSVLALAALRALEAVGADGTLLLTPGRDGTGTQSHHTPQDMAGTQQPSCSSIKRKTQQSLHVYFSN